MDVILLRNFFCSRRNIFFLFVWKSCFYRKFTQKFFVRNKTKNRTNSYYQFYSTLDMFMHPCVPKSGAYVMYLIIIKRSCVAFLFENEWKKWSLSRFVLSLFFWKYSHSNRPSVSIDWSSVGCTRSLNSLLFYYASTIRFFFLVFSCAPNKVTSPHIEMCSQCLIKQKLVRIRYQKEGSGIELCAWIKHTQIQSICMCVSWARVNEWINVYGVDLKWLCLRIVFITFSS